MKGYRWFLADFVYRVQPYEHGPEHLEHHKEYIQAWNCKVAHRMAQSRIEFEYRCVTKEHEFTLVQSQTWGI